MSSWLWPVLNILCKQASTTLNRKNVQNMGTTSLLEVAMRVFSINYIPGASSRPRALRFIPDTSQASGILLACVIQFCGRFLSDAFVTKQCDVNKAKV